MWFLITAKTDSENFLDVQKWFHLLGCKTQSFQWSWQQRFRAVQNLTIQGDFNLLIRLKNLLVIAAETVVRQKNLCPVLIPTMSEGMDGQLKLIYKVVDVVVRANRKTCVTLLRYNVKKPESSCAQFGLFPRKKEDEQFQQNVCLKFKLENLSLYSF